MSLESTIYPLVFGGIMVGTAGVAIALGAKRERMTNFGMGMFIVGAIMMLAGFSMVGLTCGPLPPSR